MNDAIATRKNRAWLFVTLGVLIAWGALGVATSTGAVLAWVVFVAAVALLVYGITLFDRPRR